MPVVAIVGATGAVGGALCELLVERDFPISELRLFASARSSGKSIDFKGQQLTIETLTEQVFAGIDIVFFAIGAEESRKYAPHAVKAGCIVIDNSNAYRMDADVPLVVPEVNPGDIQLHQGIIANPNCSTIQMVVALNPLHQAATITRVVGATYQAVSGSGLPGMMALENEVQAYATGQPMPVTDVYPAQILFNAIPQIDTFMENGYTGEEMKMVEETRKIMHAPNMQISMTCVRIPVMRAHSEAIQIETAAPLGVEQARELLRQAPNVELIDTREPGGYPLPLDVARTQMTYVGRLRQDISSQHGLAFWIVADQIYKGAALNAIQIAELL